METKVCFNNSKGQKICGILSNPGTNHAIIICHGLGYDKDVPRYKILQDKINNLGIATFRIDFLGHGESEGNYEDLTLTEAIDDITRAKNVLKKKGFKIISFIGSSFGALSGLISASSHNEFTSMILISPPSHYDISEIFVSGMYLIKELRKFRKIKEKLNDKRKAGIKIKFFRDYASYDSYDAADKLDIPVLIIHGSDDKIVPLDKSRELHKHLKNSKMKILKGADHQYSHPSAHKKLIELTIEYTRKFHVQ
jgi:pimeloyl-ACP methyl ester carboxylesterase